MIEKKLLSGSAMALCAALSAGIANAQEPAPGGDGDIVVTAQKRAQKTTDVPISVTVLGARQLAAIGITDNSAIANQTPGLAWGSTSNKSKPYIFMRGVGNADFQSGSNSPVGIYSDGVYQGNSFGVGALLMDLDRVEILRGPQGTLWGKNTTGGLINYVPKLAKVGEPANGAITLGYGNFNAITVEAAGGVPLTDKLATRIAFSTTRDDGQSRSVNPLTQGRIGGSNWFAARGSLAFAPNEGTVLTATINYSDLDGQLRPTKSLGLFDPTMPFSFTPCASASAGTLGTSCGNLLGYVSSPNPYVVAPSQVSKEQVKNYGGTLKADIELGSLSLAAITAYNHSARDYFADSDFTPTTLYEYNVQDRFRSISQELRLSSDTHSAFSWIAGAYYYQDRLEQYQAFNLPVFGPVSPANSITNRSKNYAAFGDATYKISDHWTVLAGLRLTRDERDASGIAFTYAPVYGRFNTSADALASIVATTGDFSGGVKRSDTDLSGRVGIQYHIERNTMLYATAARGFKGGDVNSGALEADAFLITKPETLTSYEGGFKTSQWNDRVQFSLSGFYYDYKDAQVNTERSGDGGAVLVVLSNAGKLRIYGFDGEIAARPVDNFHINFGFSYIDSRYTQYIGPEGSDFSGNTPPYTSKCQLNALADYTVPLGGAGSLAMQVDASYRTRAYFTPDDDPKLSQPGYALVNASLTWAGPDQNWSLRAWVKNIGDKLHYIGGYAFTALGANFLLPGDRRTYGVSASFTF